MRAETKPFEILLAEDNSDDVALVRQALRGHHVDCVLHVIGDGEEAIEWITSRDADPKAPPLDLVILDMHLPKRDGDDVLKRLRSTRQYAETPVVVMTSLDSTVLEDRAASRGPVVHFRKPSSLGEFMRLGSIIRRVLGQEEVGAAT